MKQADGLPRGAAYGANDLWIAAHAFSLGMTVITDNEREFSRVPGLRVENWLRVAHHDGGRAPGSRPFDI